MEFHEGSVPCGEAPQDPTERRDAPMGAPAKQRRTPRGSELV